MSKIIKKIQKGFKDPYRIILYLNAKGLLAGFSDKKFISLMYRASLGKKPNLKNPQTYNEKLQWLKLYNRNPLYTTLVDKYAVKDYVAKAIGDEYIIPTLGVWDSFDEIDFDSLPEQFVLKCTHDSGGLVIVKDKSKLDKNAAREKINAGMKNNYYKTWREWPYKNVKPRIIAEAYMEDERVGELPDYKFFTFDGKVKALFIATERQLENEETKFDFYDENYNHLPFRNGHPNASTPPAKPQCFDNMIKLAEKLSKDIPHVRVDFYEVNGKIYFGELTFYHYSGFVPFEPEEWDYTFGSWINLPEEKKVSE